MSSAPTTERTVTTLVVGTGPSGILAAHYAVAAGSVLMIDRFTLPRDKSCGGMIHPLAQRILTPLAEMPKELLLEPEQVSFRYNDWDKRIIRDTKLFFWNVDRKPFDEWMMSLVQNKPGIDIEDATEYKSHEVLEDGRLRVELNKRGVTEYVICDYLVGGDGGRSGVRRSLGIPDFERYLTLQDYCVRTGSVDPVFDCFWAEEISGLAIGYVIPKNERVLVGLVYYPGTKRAHEKQDQALAMLRTRLNIGESLKREAWMAPRHHSVADICPGRVQGRSAVLLTGEAGGYLSPTSGEGISWALHSGQAAGRAIATGGSAEQVLATYTEGVARLRRMIAWRLKIFPLMNSRRGKTLFGYLPQFFIERLTNHI